MISTPINAITLSLSVFSVWIPHFMSSGDDAVRWCAAPRDGSLAWRLREDGGDVVRTTSLKDPNKKHQKNHPFLLVKQGQSIGNFRDFWWNGAEWDEKMTTIVGTYDGLKGARIRIRFVTRSAPSFTRSSSGQ